MARENLASALRRVERNAGAAGIDGMTTRELRPWLSEHWPGVRVALDAGTYRPQPVRRVMIPKPAAGERMLGVPTVLDRLVQQAVLQVLEPVFEPHFSDHSFGFRPGRSAHQAVGRARQFIEDDAAWVVDVDLDAFFDRVQHDALMARLARRVKDKQVLKLIRCFLEAGVMAAQFVEQRLKLRVNAAKSAVGPATRRTFLGFSFYRRDGKVKIGVDRKAPKRAKQRLRQLTARTWGVSMDRRIHAINRFTVGWTAYFALADGERPFKDLDEWLRRRLRQVRWKEWKRYSTRRRNLRALGMPERAAREWAASQKGPWRIAGSYVLQRALPNAYWTNIGLHGFTDPYRRLRDAKRTAGCGPACPVVWEGRG